MLEIEMKFRVDDFAAVAARLAEWGAEAGPQEIESDHYYNAPDRDFGKTDEALRLRRVGTSSRITYKGPKQPGPTKTRTEIEVPLADGDGPAGDFLRVLEKLGYRATAVVNKKRTSYAMRRGDFVMNVCLDDVERVGRFVEVEIVATADRRDDADRILMRTATELGLTQYEPRSYLHMVLELSQ